MKTRNSITNSATVLALLAVVAVLFSGCGQPTPPGKGGDGGDNKQPENAEKRIYWFDYNAKTETQSGIVYSVNLDCKDKRQEFGIPKPEPQSDYVLKTGFVFYPYVNIVSISKNKKFILFSTEFAKSLNVENGETYLVDGKKVEGIEVNEYSIYEPSTKEFHYIGALCKYEFNIYPPQTIKEIGHKYYPAGWLDDELLLVETTKDEKIYTERQDAAVKVTESNIEVPYATAKAVSFSLKDFTLSPTDKFKPLKPWTSYSDTNTGIVGYFDPFYPFTKALYLYYPETYGEMRYPGFNTVITTLSDLKGTKNYDLYNLAEKALPKDYALGRSFFLGSMIDKNNKKMCYYIMEGHQKNIKNNEKAKHEYIVFGLDFNTGNIKKYMDMNRINAEVKKFVKFPDKITDITISHAYTLDGLTFTKETGPTFFFRCLVRYKDTVNPSTKYMEFLIYGPNLDKLKKMETSFPFRFEYYCIR
ncbi:MAG TPA: hypothetical protein PK835_03530 [Caldisericia bacterium]|nr:hypothetical protein [Caldisericia bacterium]